MANPRYYHNGPTSELEFKVMVARYVYEQQMLEYPIISEIWGKELFRSVQKAYFIGSEASRNHEQWKSTSDIDIKLFIEDAPISVFYEFKRDCLDPVLHFGGPNPQLDKPYWIDLFMDNQHHRIFDPKIDITDIWRLPNCHSSYEDISEVEKESFNQLCEHYRLFAEQKTSSFDYNTITEFTC